MFFWMREASLQVGRARYPLDHFYFEFEVPFEDSDTLQQAAFTIYNLAETTRKGVKRGDAVILNAGYQGDIGVIFIGQVSACSHQHKGTDWITKITAAAVMEEWLNKKVSKTYAKGMTAKQIIPDLLNLFGVEIGAFELAENKVYDRGRVCDGRLKDVLKEIVVSECKSRFLIRNGNVVITAPEKGMKHGYILTPESGLLFSNGNTEETVAAVGVNSQKSGAERTQEGNYITRECLLNYHLGPAEEVQIQSKALTGRYVIVKGKHTGSPKGQWKTTLEMRPA